jgi:hypothetical protein
LALNFEYEYEDDDEYEAEDMLPNIVLVLVLLLVLDNGIFEMPTHVYFRTDNPIRSELNSLRSQLE